MILVLVEQVAKPEEAHDLVMMFNRQDVREALDKKGIDNYYQIPDEERGEDAEEEVHLNRDIFAFVKHRLRTGIYANQMVSMIASEVIALVKKFNIEPSRRERYAAYLEAEPSVEPKAKASDNSS